MKAIKLKGETVTIEDVKNAITEVKFVKLGKKIVVCHITLLNGFEVIGKSGVVDPDLFDMKIGGEIAKENAIDEIWFHLGSILQNKLAESNEVWDEVEELRRKGIGNI